MADQSVAVAHVAVRNGQRTASNNDVSRRSLLQRTCTCGRHVTGGGECDECRRQRLSVQRSRRGYPGRSTIVSDPGDHWEREAQHVAEAIAAEPLWPVPRLRQVVSTSAPIRVRRSAREETAPASPALTELRWTQPVLDVVPSGRGAPLPPGLRSSFEERLGYDLTGVRVHTDAEASRMAESVGARAYTVGGAVVFGSGEFRPSTHDGRRLLAHELVHVVQQGGAGRTDRKATPRITPTTGTIEGIVQRQCLPIGICPLVALDVGGEGFRWEAAETCLQQQYPKGGLVGFNKTWRALSAPRGTPEGRDLECFKSHLAAKSGMFLAQPDIIDFTRAEIYDVTTVGQASRHRVRLWADTQEATALSAIPDCSGASRRWTPGTWQPSPCYALGNDMFMRAWNDQGLLLYQMLRDLTKEALTALALATLYATFKNQIGKKLATAVVTKNPYVAAAFAAAAVAIVLTTDAKISFAAGDDPVSATLKALKARGLEVPPEIEAAIKSDPALRARIEAAMEGRGTPSERAKRASNELMKLIAANKDKFSREDLEALVTIMEGPAKHVPGSAVTLEQVRAQINAIRSGKARDPEATAGQSQGGPGRAQPGAAAPEAKGAAPPGSAAQPTPATAPARSPGAPSPVPLRPETVKKLAAAPERVRQLLEALTAKSGTRPELAVRDEDVERFLRMVPPTLTQQQLDDLLKRERPEKARSASEVLDRLEGALAERHEHASYSHLKPETVKKLTAAPPQVRRILEEMTTGAGKGPAFDDAAVERFLKIMAAKLTPAQYEAIANKLRPVKPGEKITDVLAALERAVAAATKTAEPSSSAPASHSVHTRPGPRSTTAKGTPVAGGKPGKPGKPGGPVKGGKPGARGPSKRDPEAEHRVNSTLAGLASVADFSGMKPNDYKVVWETLEKATATVWIKAKSRDDVPCIGVLTVQILELTPTKAKMKVLSSTALVDRYENEIYELDELGGVTLDVQREDMPELQLHMSPQGTVK